MGSKKDVYMYALILLGGWLLPHDRLPRRLAAILRSASTAAAALPGGYLLISCSRLSAAVCSPSIFKIRRDS